MKTCIDCQFMSRKAMDVGNGRLQTVFVCENSENIDPVDGSPLPCNIARTNTVFCGIEAKHWKKKEVEQVKGTEGKVIQLA